MLNFDEFGYLKPYEAIPASFEDIEKHFIFNTRRETLYTSFRAFLEELRATEIKPLYIWINGSFTTLKKYPKDIDLVLFVPFEVYYKTKKPQWFLRRKYTKTLDIFFEPEYPKLHPLHSKTLDDREYWLKLYCYDRKGFDKGILEIKL